MSKYRVDFDDRSRARIVEAESVVSAAQAAAGKLAGRAYVTSWYNIESPGFGLSAEGNRGGYAIVSVRMDNGESRTCSVSLA